MLHHYNYNLIVFDEIHRTGANEWYKYIKETVENQDESTKVLGISATPQ
ncbi:MAG: DEAD/DEAH box helicase family protein, partial [Clostridia bacterium]|nr:DEAD/DEAH box helicase family protein [Clostridia bacterium]